MADITLKAGDLDLVYQNGFIRYIQLGELEVIRMINHALRAHNWGTVPMNTINEKIQTSEGGFHFAYQGRFFQDTIDFDLECQIEGFPEGKITFSYEGTANSSFKKNRVGFTVLHPIAPCA